MNEKQMKANLFFTTFAFILSLAINFYITPLISKNLGDAAYGFVSMANDFVSYAAIISAVLNSVSARFVALEIYKNQYEKANKYYSSVFIVNVILAVLLSILGIVFIVQIDGILSVPASLVGDVQITFLLTFLNYIIVLCSSIFTVCTYVTNRLDISGIRNIISYLIKFVIVLLLFNLLEIHMYFIAIATVVSSVFLAVTNIQLTKKLLPKLKFKFSFFDIKYVKILALSGIWMAISNLSQVLMTGLDSVITNTMLGADAMGTLSVSRTIPNAVISAISTIGIIFTPNFVELYAKGKNNELIEACKKSMKVMTVVLGVPIVGVCIFGERFYSLWLPYKTPDEIILIQTLSVLMMIQSVFNMMTISIAQLSVVTNKLKVPVFVSISLGVINILLVIFLVNHTFLGLYAVAGVSSVLFIVRYFLFNPIYAAYTIKAKWYAFYGTVLRCSIPVLVTAAVFAVINRMVKITGWGTFIVVIIFAGAFGYAIIIASLIDIKEFIHKGKKERKSAKD